MKRFEIVCGLFGCCLSPLVSAQAYAPVPEAPSLTITLLGVLLVAVGVVDRKVRRVSSKRLKK